MPKEGLKLEDWSWICPLSSSEQIRFFMFPLTIVAFSGKMCELLDDKWLECVLYQHMHNIKATTNFNKHCNIVKLWKSLHMNRCVNTPCPHDSALSAQPTCPRDSPAVCLSRRSPPQPPHCHGLGLHRWQPHRNRRTLQVEFWVSHSSSNSSSSNTK